MSEENKEKLEALQGLVHSKGFAMLLQKGSEKRYELYTKALKTNDEKEAKHCLENIKGIDYILNLPNSLYHQIQFETKQEEQPS